MKEDIFDVLIYLFENYLDGDSDRYPDTDEIANELLEAGFQQPDVSKAFDWLESLAEIETITPAISSSFRIFSSQEIAVFDLECRDFLMFLEHSGILSPANREIAIDRAMALQDENITLDRLKWIVLMVLLSQPGDSAAFSRMEDIVYDLIPTSLH
jgi:Smg protein